MRILYIVMSLNGVRSLQIIRRKNRKLYYCINILTVNPFYNFNVTRFAENRCNPTPLIQKESNLMTQYSLNLRTLVEEHQESNSLATRPITQLKDLNPTQIKMNEIKENMRRFALNFYTPDQLKKAHPKHDYYKSIRKVQEDILRQYLPSPEGIFNVKSK